MGSRLWPVSREHHPKPFIRLTDGHSLLQHTWLRGAALPQVDEIVTVTNRELFFKTQDDYDEIKAGHLIHNSYILEPCGRNTAAAITAAALQIAEIHGEDAILLVLAADHLISNHHAFSDAVSQATELAKQDKLVVFGIKPSRPETAYGYIEVEKGQVVQFIEKPSLALATKYSESDRYLWNAGMFCFTAGTLIKEMKLHASDIISATKSCIKQSKMAQAEDYTQLQLDRELFAAVADMSIDYALMEKSENVTVVPCDLAWSDIGSWDAMADLCEPDQAGNRIEGEALLHKVTNTYIRSDSRVVAAVGVDNLVVVDTADALLVADRNSVQNVKQIYMKLKETGHDAYKLHRMENRPWGSYTVLYLYEGFKIKKLEVNPGASLSLQIHHHRCEHWIVVSGVAKVFRGDEHFFVHSNESTYIKAGQKHRLENSEKSPLIIIEVQTGDYLEEDDIIRFEENN